MLLLLLPALVTLPMLDPERAIAIAGITLSAEKMIVAMLIACTVVVALGSRRVRLPALDPWLLRMTGLCLVAIVAGAVLSAQRGPTTYLARDVSMYVLKLSIPLIIVWSVGSLEDARSFCLGLVLLPLITAGQMIWQVRAGFALEAIYEAEGLERTTLVDRNFTALLLVTGALSCLYYRRVCFRTARVRKAMVAVTAVLLALVPFTTSRSGVLALGMVLLVGMASERRGAFRWVVLLALLGLGLTTIRFLTGSAGVVERLASLSTAMSDPGERRSLIWPAAVAALQGSPVTGLGIGQYRWLVSLQAADFFVAMHNAYLLLYADLGVFGLVAYGGLAVAYLRLLGRLRASGDRALADIAMAGRLGLVVVLVYGVGSDIYLVNQSWLMMAVAPALWRAVALHRAAPWRRPAALPVGK